MDSSLSTETPSTKRSRKANSRYFGDEFTQDIMSNNNAQNNLPLDFPRENEFDILDEPLEQNGNVHHHSQMHNQHYQQYQTQQEQQFQVQQQHQTHQQQQFQLQQQQHQMQTHQQQQFQQHHQQQQFQLQQQQQQHIPDDVQNLTPTKNKTITVVRPITTSFIISPKSAKLQQEQQEPTLIELTHPSYQQHLQSNNHLIQHQQLQHQQPQQIIPQQQHYQEDYRLISIDD